MSVEVKTIGFDGPSRCGKGTQIARLSESFSALGIPFLVVRGDGTKQHTQKTDSWWETMNQELTDDINNTDKWAKAAYRLAQELIHVRDSVLPKMAETLNSPVAFLLVDRTLLSRTMMPREENPATVLENLYPDKARDGGPKITAEEVCPDIIFNISADVGSLLARLDPEDEKYEFRKEMILRRAEWYRDAEQFIPASLRNRIVTIDGTQDIRDVFEQILMVIMAKYPEHFGKKTPSYFQVPVEQPLQQAA